MADCSCRYELDLCSDCDGLRVTRLLRLSGVTGLTITYDSGETEHRTPSAVYLGPAPEPCPNRPEVIRRG
ncbi:hypothetical protein [Streptomyces sp. G1]|uniref:hypothetical protein n=1 Tax=Streptomyces sp. G1 TaxID=361572 RepID=UPI00202E44A3|nr:hypothetical protein [Streptomyces sp. G1]MCM1964846.1 hypothetical protein [Streptomyces sp. G1]